jgi:hypothetical protein
MRPLAAMIARSEQAPMDRARLATLFAAERSVGIQNRPCDSKRTKTNAQHGWIAHNIPVSCSDATTTTAILGHLCGRQMPT